MNRGIHATDTAQWLIELNERIEQGRQLMWAEARRLQKEGHFQPGDDPAGFATSYRPRRAYE